MMQRRDMSVYQLEALKREAHALRSQTFRDMLKSLFSRPSANVTSPSAMDRRVRSAQPEGDAAKQ